MEDLTPSAGSVLRGVVRGPDGVPVQGARVAITASPVPVPEIAAETDADGRFELAAPAAGRYTLAAHAGGAAAQESVAVPPHPAAAARSASPDADAAMSSEAPDAGLAAAATPSESHEVHVVLTLSPPPGTEP
ncbi:MAG TPA: carboxypeptidase-like regulatory domain-containing protein [Longimicrobium sp.]|nr:carboxypeptidase-like regulatory domain-containing protein [Longimicrobium sp.]